MRFSFLIGLVLSIVLLWPLTSAPYFSHHDDVQTIRLHQMHRCFEDGQLPCRWVPDLGAGYGYPLFNYYAPLPYYFGELFYWLSGDLQFAAKMMFAFGFLGAYLFMYLLARKLWGPTAGLLAGVFYSYAPYHAADLYVRGAMGELWGLMFFPALLWGLVKLYNHVRLKNVALFSLTIAGMLTSHNLSTMLIAPVMIVLTVVLLWFKTTKKFLVYLTVSLLLGAMVAAFYWLPSYVEQDQVHVESTTIGYFSYTEHFKGVRKVIFSNYWGYGGSFREIPGGPKDEMPYQVGWVHLSFFALALVLAGLSWKKLDRLSRTLIALFAVVVVGSVVMIHPYSLPIWKLFEWLKYLQFPWRFLSLVIFFLSLVVGSLAISVPNRARWIIVAALVLVVAFNFSYFKPEKFVYTSQQDQLSGDLWKDHQTRSIFDFLPKSAEAPPGGIAPAKYEVLTGEVAVSNYRQGTDWIWFDGDAKRHSILRLSQYYFPNWRIFVDGQQVPIDYNNSKGLMTIILGEGKHDVYAELSDTLIRTVSNLISVVGILLVFAIGLVQLRILKKPLLYILKSFYK